MAERITQAMLDAAFGLACTQAKNIGIDVTGWIMEHGSAANGVPWRLMKRFPDTARAPIGALGGWLGGTQREAHARLVAYREAWLLVGESRSE